MSRAPAGVEKREGGGAGERFTVVVLAAIAAALAYVRLQVLPSQEKHEPLAFAFHNPMLDAKEGERVLFHKRGAAGNTTCARVRKDGLVLRPSRGADRIGAHTGLRTSVPYLACSFHDMRQGVEACGGPETESVLYGLNYFGMPRDTKVRVNVMRPRWMRWGERELAVYEVVLERYGPMAGRWTTFIAEEAPVAGLVKMATFDPAPLEVQFREVRAAP